MMMMKIIIKNNNNNNACGADIIAQPVKKFI